MTSVEKSEIIISTLNFVDDIGFVEGARLNKIKKNIHQMDKFIDKLRSFYTPK